MNGKQSLVVRAWLACVALLALYPPFEFVPKATNGAPLVFQTYSQHRWVFPTGPVFVDDTPSAAALVNYPPIITVATFNSPVFACELLAMTAIAGIAFLSLGHRENGSLTHRVNGPSGSPSA